MECGQDKAVTAPQSSTSAPSLAQQADGNNVEELNNNIASCLMDGLTSTIGLKRKPSTGRTRKLPPDLVRELKKKRLLSKAYKTKVTKLTAQNLHITPSQFPSVVNSDVSDLPNILASGSYQYLTHNL